jgi:plastocyanin
MHVSISRTRATLALSTAGLAIALAACGGSSATVAPAVPAAPTAAPASEAPASEAPAAGGSAVSIKNFAFNPGSITVAAGTTVTWTNDDTTGHTVTADDGSFDSKTVAAGATFSQAFATAGTFTYHCTIHTNMTATVVVQ